jgi:hypothetical protein
MSYLALIKEGDAEPLRVPQKSIGQILRTFNVAIRLEIDGQDIWFIPHEKARQLVSLDGLCFLPDEVEFLHKMPLAAIKAVFLIKSRVGDARLVSYKGVH